MMNNSIAQAKHSALMTGQQPPHRDAVTQTGGRYEGVVFGFGREFRHLGGALAQGVRRGMIRARSRSVTRAMLGFLFGSHLSIAGSMVNALTEATSLGLDTVQVFTKNQQQWKAKPLDSGMVRDWLAEVRRIGFDKGGPGDALGDHRGGVTSHASYLINLAAPADELWSKSIDLMTDEVARCEQLEIPFLVHHPGAYTTSSLDAGLARIAEAYGEVFRRTKGARVVSCLEGTVGAGSQIGGKFEELARLRELIIDRTGEPARIGYCLDTCHMHAAGYDMSSQVSAQASLDEFDRTCGLAFLKVLHINDSKGVVGSHLDRHMHVGEGTIGGPASSTGVTLERLRRSGFATVVNNPRLAGVPKHLETPKEDGPPGSAWDTINLARLRSLMPGGEGLWPSEQNSVEVGSGTGRVQESKAKARTVRKTNSTRAGKAGTVEKGTVRGTAKKSTKNAESKPTERPGASGKKRKR